MFDAYCRLFLGSILPDDVDRAVFLDCDTLCNGSISDFYNTDLGDNLAAGVIDCLSDAYYDLFNMDETSRYCNSGVVLLDLKKWREQHIESAITEYVRKNNGYVFFMEQSVMNIVLQNKIKIVHPCNNTYTLMVAFSYENLRRLRKCKRYYSDEEIDEAISKPTLIHLTTNFYVKGRPWVKGNKHPFSQLFLKYRAYTPWKEEPLFEDQSTWKQKAIVSILHLLPQTFICSVIGWIYNVWRPHHIQKNMLNRNK